MKSMEFKYINYGHIDNKRGKTSDIYIGRKVNGRKPKHRMERIMA